MPRPTDPADVVVIALADGPIHHDDGTEYLIPLTPCCHASGKGAESATGVVCRGCYREVDPKYGGDSSIAIARA